MGGADLGGWDGGADGFVGLDLLLVVFVVIGEVALGGGIGGHGCFSELVLVRERRWGRRLVSGGAVMGRIKIPCQNNNQTMTKPPPQLDSL